MMDDPVTAYAKHVVSGGRIGCKYEVLACQRHLDDLAAGEYFFDEAAARAAIGIFPKLRHYKGKFAGQPFTLHPSQEFIVGSIYGWRMKAGGVRRFTSAYVEMPRKNGKTTLSAGIGVLGLLEERGAEVYSVATKEDQAKIGWKDGRAMIKASDSLRNRFTLRVKEIKWEDRDSFWKPLGSDSETLDGLNPSLALIDELHAWINRDLFDVIEDGMGAREQPLIFIITTAGKLTIGICVERRNLIVEILERRVENGRVFGIIFAPDEDDDPHLPATWHKANPLLGEAKSEDFMAEQSKLARQTPGKLNTFLTKQLNIWVQQDKRWLDLDQWDACRGDLPPTDGLQCSGGLDLSTTIDLAGLSRLFRFGDRRVMKWLFWVPEDSMRERVKRDRVPYDVWVREGLIRTTPGNVVDYNIIQADILKLHSETPFCGLAYDPWNATQIATNLQGEGLPMISFRQGYASMSPAAKEFEKRIARKDILHDGNKVMRWMIGHVAKEEDPAGNIKPSKRKSRERIDGVVAAIMATGHDMVATHQPATPSISFF